MKETIDIIYVYKDTKIKNGLLNKKDPFIAYKDGSRYVGVSIKEEVVALALASHFKSMATFLRKQEKVKLESKALKKATKDAKTKAKK